MVDPAIASRFKNCDFIFTNDGSVPPGNFSFAKAKLDKLAPLPHWTLHDLRRSAATGCARIGVNPIVADKLLNHKRGELTEIAKIYQKHDYEKECQAALTLWGNHVAALTGGATNIVPMKRGA